jgi:hypothetical protein
MGEQTYATQCIRSIYGTVVAIISGMAMDIAKLRKHQR